MPASRASSTWPLGKMQQLRGAQRTDDDRVVGRMVCVLIAGILRGRLSNEQRSALAAGLHPAQDFFRDFLKQCVVHVSIIPRLPF